MEKLNKKDIHEILSQTLPEQNDFYKTDYSEELKKLLDFGIDSKISLLDLVVKHRENVLEIDAEEIDDFHFKYYSEEYGKDYVNVRVENKFWFSYSGLLKIILELEFGEVYKDYADKRDGI